MQLDASVTSSRWVPLLEYAVATGVSMSTLRRQIKNGRIPFRVDLGRYYLELPATPGASAERELARAHEEIAELKTLIAYYEEILAKGAPGPRAGHS